MRVRRMVGGDMTFGKSSANFLVNSPDAVAQVIGSRLGLWVGEWFLDTSAGTPWMQQVIGFGTQPLYDQAIRERILGSPGVLSLTQYSSQFTASARSLAVTATVSTLYGSTAAVGAITPPA